MLIHEPEPGNYSYAIQITEGTLGVLMSSMDFGDPSELLVWNWETGQLRLVRFPQAASPRYPFGIRAVCADLPLSRH